MNAGSFDVEIGERLRALRLKHGLSQRALAKRAGVSNATISMIEGGRTNPSVSGLRQILSGIPISLAQFFAEDSKDDDKVVFRAAELTEIGAGAVSYRQVGSNLIGRSLQMIHERYQPGAESGQAMLTHLGEEAGLIIKGQMLLEVAGRRYEMRAGDAYLFDSRKPHWFKNIGETELVLVSACTPPTF